MRASRLLSILLLLQARGRMTAQALAEEFETSVRTIYRDMDDLSAAGVPIYADRGRMGGFQLLEGYRTQLTGLTIEEADALFLSGLPGPAADLGLGTATAAARLKLLAALPSSRREGAQRVASRFHMDPVGWFRAAERTDLLPILADAVWKARRIDIKYRRSAGTVDRRLEPLGLALKAGVWYLVAASGGQPRTYRLSAIESVLASEETFVRPEDFNLAAYWTAAAKEYEAGLHQGQARLRASPEATKRILTLHPSAAVDSDAPDADGWSAVTVPIESIDIAVGEILKLGADVEVLAPEELRRQLSETVAALARIYDVRPSA